MSKYKLDLSKAPRTSPATTISSPADGASWSNRDGLAAGKPAAADPATHAKTEKKT